MKNLEIERKFLVDFKNLPDLSKKDYQEITQGYMQNMGGNYTFRLRQVLDMSYKSEKIGEQYFQTIKGEGLKIREEFEIELLKSHFTKLWPLCKNISLTKKRYEITLDKQEGIIISLDIYKNFLKGLCVAEVEFNTEEECDTFSPPRWFGKEVTEDESYSNWKLAINGLPEDFDIVFLEKPKNYFDYVKKLINKYKCASWGGRKAKFNACVGSSEDDVIVYERGVKGAADWFLFKNGFFEHRGYTGYKDKYNYKQFEAMVKKIDKNNKEWVTK